jgi:hypothetical protein
MEEENAGLEWRKKTQAWNGGRERRPRMKAENAGLEWRKRTQA